MPSSSSASSSSASSSSALGTRLGTGTRFFLASASAAAKKEGPRRTLFTVRKENADPASVGPAAATFVRTSSYVGAWAGDRRAGFGRQVYVDGRVYEGQWMHNRPHGAGTLTVPLGGPARAADGIKRHSRLRLVKEYEGEHFDGQRHGRGTLRLPGGDVYEGEFARGRREGRGRLVAADGSVYEGGFRNDLKEGRGVLLMPNGDRFEGFFEADLKNGPGTLIYASRRMVLEGEWRRGTARCGEMRQILHEADEAAPLAAATAADPAVQKRGAFPQLELVGPLAVLSDAASTARLEAAAEAAVVTLHATGGGLGPGEEAEELDLVSGLQLGAEELTQLVSAFRAGEEASREFGVALRGGGGGIGEASGLGEDLLPADTRVLARVLAVLGISPSETELWRLLESLVAAQLRQDEEHLQRVVHSGGTGISFRAFATVMADLRAD